MSIPPNDACGNEKPTENGAPSPLDGKISSNGEELLRRDRWVRGVESIARLMGIAPKTLSNLLSAGKLDIPGHPGKPWLLKDGRRWLTQVGSGDYWRDVLNKQIHATAAKARGAAGSAAVMRDASGRFTQINGTIVPQADSRDDSPES